MSMNTFPWEDGTVVERPYVEINGTKHYVQDGTISGGTPASSTNLNEMQDIINDNITDKVDGRNYIAWRNLSPDESFSAKTIYLNKSMDGYSHYEILFRQSTTSARIMSSGKIPNGYGTILNLSLESSYFRPTSVVVEGGSITFEDCHVSNGTTSNNMLIPYMVIFHDDKLW